MPDWYLFNKYILGMFRDVCAWIARSYIVTSIAKLYQLILRNHKVAELVGIAFAVYSSILDRIKKDQSQIKLTYN